ncbi:MAG: MBL fold metallo-hydrolase [Thermodesulfobacteriota bacterium]|nr:MBL fold metallo-hydrolase [Thermodesulfobacteriota bacterium]
MFVKQLEVGNLAVFAYIVGCKETGEGLVIDPASNAERIISISKENGIDIKYIVNTHSHIDHTMGNADMAAKTGAKIIIHEYEKELLTKQPSFFLSMFGSKESPPADITVKDEDTIDIGKLSLKVILTPGHSPGGITLHLNGYLFTGDTLFVGGVGRTDVPGGSWPVLLRSINTRILTFPDETIIMPGHNYGYAPTSTVKQEKDFNPFVKDTV